MSDPTTPTPSPAPQSDSSKSDSSAKTADKTPKKGRWRRRLIWMLGIVIFIAILFRVILILALPSVIKKVAAIYDLNCDYERMELYLVDSDVGIWHLKLTPKSGGKPLLDAEYCRAHVSVINLLRGRLVVRRLEADGLDLNIERNEKGEIPLLERFIASNGKTPAAKPKTDSSTASQDLSLDSPLEIDALRVSRARAHIIDRAVIPNVETQLDLSLRLSDLGPSLRPTRFLMDITSPPLLDMIRIEGEGVASGQTMDAKMQVFVRGIHPKPAAGYLKPLGLRPGGDDISMRLTATVKTEPDHKPTTAPSGGAAPTTRPTGIKGTVVLSDIALVADGIESAGVNKITLDISSLTPKLASFSKLLIEGVRANAKRLPDGTIRAAGLDLVGGAEPSEPSNITLLPWSLAELSIRDVRATFRDDAIAPATDLSLLVPRVDLKNIVSEAQLATGPTTILAIAGVPGVIETMTLEGTCDLISPRKTAKLKFSGEGIKPDTLKPYLDAAGIESELKNGKFSADITAAFQESPTGVMTSEAKIGNVLFTDTDELFRFDGVTIGGAAYDPQANRVTLATIDITGPTVSAQRSADGVLSAMGLKVKPNAARPVAQPVAAVQPPVAAAPQKAASTQPTASAHPATQPAVAVIPPKLLIGKLTWKGIDVRFDDDVAAKGTSFRLQDAGVELSNINIDLDPKAAAGEPGKINAWLSMPGVIGKIAATGTMSSQANAMKLDLSVDGTGLKAGPISPYLKLMGVEPVLKDGALHLKSQVALSRTDTGIGANLALKDLKYTDGKDELIGIDGVIVSGVDLNNAGLTVALVEVNKPRARAMRDADGSLVVGGARFGAPSTQPAGAEPAAAAVPTSLPSTPESAMAAILGKLRVNDASLNWTDRAVNPAVEAVGHANVAIDNVVLGKKADPATVNVSLKLDNTLESASVIGQVSTAPGAPSAKLDIVANGITEGALASYLPPGAHVNLKDGRFRVKLDAGIEPNSAGGQKARFIVTDLDYRDGEAGQPLFRFDSAKILASRIDLRGKIVAIDEISLAGLETSAVQTADGATELMGLRMSAPPPEEARKAIIRAEQASTQAAVAQHNANVAAGAPTGVASKDVAALLAQQREPQPLITLEKLDINLRKITGTNAGLVGAKPLVLADVDIRNRKKIELLGPDPFGRPPVEIDITGNIDPVVQTFAVGIVTAPFASQPTLQVDVSATGIKGQGVTELLPQLAEKIDGKSLTDGQFKAHLEGQAKFAKLGPAKYDLTQPIDAEFVVRPLEYRAEANGAVLAGVEEVRADGIRVEPQTGNITVRSLEITKPIGRVYRENDGIHILGLVLKSKPAATQPAEEEPAKPAEPAVAEAPAPVVKPTSEKRIDKLVVSGIDFIVEDRTTDPGLIVPLNSLDVEVRDLSNMALFEDRPIRFSALVGADKVPMYGGSERELFSQAAAAGKLSLYPAPKGWVKSSVSGFELLSLYGPAKAQKVTIGGGVFDATVDLRFKDDTSLDTRSKFMITDLKVTEPDDGPIRKTLQLPSPLGAVITVLEDQDGTITVPLNVAVKEGEVSTGAVVNAGIGAFGSIVATAIASTPLKIAGGLGNLMGMEQKDKEKGVRVAGEFDFVPADTELAGTSGATLDSLIAQMKKNRKLEVTLRHELGSADITRAALLANPSPADARELAEQLRERKDALLRSRNELAMRARALLSSGGSSEASEVVDRLRMVNRELAITEDGLDRVLELLRPGADRQASRRTRAACIEIGQARLDTIQSALLASGVPNIDQRVKVIRPQFAQPEGDNIGKVTASVLEKKKS